jgi:hypothetical protein
MSASAQVNLWHLIMCWRPASFGLPEAGWAATPWWSLVMKGSSFFLVEESETFDETETGPANGTYYRRHVKFRGFLIVCLDYRI